MRFVNGPDRMTAEWPLQGNSCMQDARSLVGEHAVPVHVWGSTGAALHLPALGSPLFYCFLLAKETNLCIGLAQKGNSSQLKRGVDSVSAGSPKCRWQEESRAWAFWEGWASLGTPWREHWAALPWYMQPRWMLAKEMAQSQTEGSKINPSTVKTSGKGCPGWGNSCTDLTWVRQCSFKRQTRVGKLELRNYFSLFFFCLICCSFTVIKFFLLLT